MWCVPELDEGSHRQDGRRAGGIRAPLRSATARDLLGREARHPARRCPAPPLPARPGRDARRDSEYERRGTANALLVVEPKGGPPLTFATPDRSAFEFAQVVVQLALQYRGAETIHLVLDNLNIHCRKSLTDLLGMEMGKADLGPVYGSLHAQARQLAQSGGDAGNRALCAAVLGARRISDLKALRRGIAGLESARQSRTNEDRLADSTRKDARRKFGYKRNSLSGHRTRANPAVSASCFTCR